MATYDLGDVVALSVNVKNSAGALADATAVVCTVTLPDGTTATPTVTHASTGVYSAGYSPTLAGRHLVNWVATGANASAYTDVFNVNDPTYAPILSLDDAKRHLNITASTSDEELRAFIDVVTQAGEAYTGRVFGRRTITETFSGGLAEVALRYCPVLSITSVVENGTTLAATGYRLSSPDGGVLTRISGYYTTPFTAGAYNVTVTYVAGYQSQPATDRLGALEMLRHLWASQRGTIRFNAAEDQWAPATTYSIPRRVAELWETNLMPGMV